MRSNGIDDQQIELDFSYNNPYINRPIQFMHIVVNSLVIGLYLLYRILYIYRSLKFLERSDKYDTSHINDI